MREWKAMWQLPLLSVLPPTRKPKLLSFPPSPPTKSSPTPAPLFLSSPLGFRLEDFATRSAIEYRRHSVLADNLSA